MVESEQPARTALERVAVVGQFRLMVEAVSLSLTPSARPVPVVLGSGTSVCAAGDAALRGPLALVALIVTPYDSIYVPDVVVGLAERGHRVVVAGELCDRTSTDELLTAGATDVLDGRGGVADLVQLVEAGPAGVGPARGPRPVRAPRHVPDALLTDEQLIMRNLARLTPAEARTLWRLMHGSSVSEIAQLHVVSVETVRSHIRAMLLKLGASSQLSAACLAWQVHWSPRRAVLDAA